LGLCVSLGLRAANDLRFDAHRDDGKRFVVRADEKLTAFIELEAAIPVSGPCHRGNRKARCCL
jgi:hypothetical protein